jgi:hypothetical protein
MSKELLSTKESITSFFLEEIRKGKISFDIDGVDAWSDYEGMNVYNKRYGIGYDQVKYTQDLVGYWTMTDWLENLNNKYIHDQSFDAVEEAISIWNDESVQKGSKPEHGAMALNLFLANHGIVPYKITSRPSISKENTYYWYRKYFPWIPKDHIFVQDGDFPDSDFKKEMIIKLGVKFHLDDSVEHALKIAESGVWVGLVPKPWNKGFIAPAGLSIAAVKDWDGRPAIIKAFLSLRDIYVEKYR